MLCGWRRELLKIFPLSKCSSRFYTGISSRDVRQQFLDFFAQEHSHALVPSSPVIPHLDPSLTFVNAGMNQFKPIFLGQVPSAYKRVVNSQKCIRVGGKHNDLDDVGRDGYHHTFFEMLGSWSFNDYFKAEACSMAWQLLTKVYKIPPQQLFITYFGGDQMLNLPADEECKEIWLSLGVAPDHLLPFGMKDNFWEMGLVGPCGPCSEIHVNKNKIDRNAARNLVNQGSEDVVEIWNLVFMQYNRLSHNILEPLPARHIDTGMGLERLVAFLQNKKSNYDTDLFLPLINSIHEIAGGEEYRSDYRMETIQGQRDCAYRLLADHSRMITVALADGAFPDNNHRLRRVIRQAIVTSRKWFKQDAELLVELSRRVADMMAEIYPELGRNLNNVHTLLRFEERVFRDQLAKSGREWTDIVSRLPELSTLPSDQQPGLVTGLRQLEDWARGVSGRVHVPGPLAFKVFHTYGLQEESLQLLSRLKGWSVDWADFHALMAEARLTTLRQSSSTTLEAIPFQCSDELKLSPTQWQCYEYFRSPQGEYVFPPMDAKVLALVDHSGHLVREATVGQRVAVIMDKSCFYYEAGGQAGDRGKLINSFGCAAKVEEVKRIGDHIFHIAVVNEGSLKVDDSIRMLLDTERRLGTMSNHTATHLLQAALKSILKVTCQKSSRVESDYFTFDFGFFDSEFHIDTISTVESTVRQWIAERLPVDRLTMPMHQAVSLDGITLLPGEAYPETVSIIKVQSGCGETPVSVEPCCGTHVRNTGDLLDFAILSLKSTGVGSRSVRAATRSVASQAFVRAKELDAEIAVLEQSVQQQCNSNNISRLSELSDLWKKLKASFDASPVSFVLARQLLARLEKQESMIRASAQEALAKTMQYQVERSVIEAGSEPFVISALSIPPHLLEIGGAKLSLIKATRHCQSKPVLVLAWDEGFLVGRCVVPQEALKENFNAEKWCNSFIHAVGGKGSSPKGQDARSTYNVRSRKLAETDMQSVQLQVVALANEYAKSHL